MFSKNFNVLIISFFCLAASVSVSAGEKKAAEQATEHSHDQEHAVHADMGMVLNEGKKWETDVPLRKGMQSIHDATRVSHIRRPEER